jgi:hypothetical protein
MWKSLGENSKGKEPALAPLAPRQINNTFNITNNGAEREGGEGERGRERKKD